MTITDKYIKRSRISEARQNLFPISLLRVLRARLPGIPPPRVRKDLIPGSLLFRTPGDLLPQSLLLLRILEDLFPQIPLRQASAISIPK